MRRPGWLAIGLLFVFMSSVVWRQLAADDSTEQVPPEPPGSEPVPEPQNAEVPLIKLRSNRVRTGMVGGYGGTKASERAVGAALNWLARHQNPDGSWSLDNYSKLCQDGSCSGRGTLKSDGAATALALLPFLGAGQTPKTRGGPYNKAIGNGLSVLVKSEKDEGDFRGEEGGIVAQSLVALVLCEAFGMTQDKELGDCAQRAIKFIERAEEIQSAEEPTDVLVAGWDVMAQQCGKLTKLFVHHETLARFQKRLKIAESSIPGEQETSQKTSDLTPLITSIELLCVQYQGMPRNDPAAIELAGRLMAHLPEGNVHNAYYWYFSTMAMRNLPGSDWDRWNRRMRRILIDSQSRYGCAAGSWNPQGDALCESGGRLLATSLCAMTLEVYYRNLPLYKAATTEETPSE